VTRNYKVITETPGWLNRLIGDGVPDSTAALYKKVPYLYRVLQVRCDTLSSVPIGVYRQGDEEDIDEQEWPYPTDIVDLLWKWEASALLSGAAYGEIVSNQSGYQKDVVYRNPFDMAVTYEDGVITIKQNMSGATWNNNIYTGDYEMFYFAEFDPSQDILPGIGAGNAAVTDIKLLFALSKFPEMYFEGGAMPVTLLGIDSTDKGEISRVEQWFKKSATAIKNAFRVLGIRAGSITPTTLTPPLKDLAMPEINAEAKHNISVAFGVPKTLLDSEAANYATASEDRKSFYEETIMPRARKYESVINEQVLAKEGLRIEFKFNELEIFQENEGERADLLYKLKLSGVPLSVALEMAGYELTNEQIAGIAAYEEENQQERERQSQQDDDDDDVTIEIRRWQRFAEKRISEGRELREFESDIIPAGLHGAISGALESAKKVEDVKRLFESVMAWEGYP
jgi:HK97 family phage portal protein